MSTILEQKSMTQMRAMEIAVFSAYILFAIAGLLFYGMVDDSPFVSLMRAHLDLLMAWVTVEGGAMVALLALLAGGIPIGLAVLKSAISARRRDILLLLAIPIAPLALVLIVRTILFTFVHGILQTTGGIAYALFIATNIIFLVALIVSPITLVLAVLRSDLNAQLFRIAHLPAIIMTLTMVGMLLATIAWGFIAYVYGQQDSNVANITALPAVFWSIIVILMTVATSVAVVATLRYQNFRSHLQSGG